MPTPQQSAILSAQNLISLAVQAQQLNNHIVAWLTDFNQNNWDSMWSQMPTVTVNSDGSLAGANDGAVNTAHPINVPATSPLLASRSQLVNVKTAVATLATVYTQAGGTVAMSAQSIIQTLAVAAPNTLG